MVQHFRLVNYHFFYPAISIVLHAEHGELATSPTRRSRRHGGLRETEALGDVGVSVPGGGESWYPFIAGWFFSGKSRPLQWRIWGYQWVPLF